MITPQTLYKLALTAARENDLRQAARLARAASELDSTDEKPRLLLGLCLYELGCLPEAAAAFSGFPPYEQAVREALEQERKAAEKIGHLVDSGKMTEARRQADNVAHQSVQWLLLRGCLSARQKRYRSASRLFATALEKDRNNPEAARYLAETAQRGSLWDVFDRK